MKGHVNKSEDLTIADLPEALKEGFRDLDGWDKNIVFWQTVINVVIVVSLTASLIR